MFQAAPSTSRVVLVNRAAGRGIPSVSWRHSQAVFAPAGFGRLGHFSGDGIGVHRSSIVRRCLTRRKSVPSGASSLGLL